MKKLVVIPAYNESENIVNTVKDILDNAPDYDYVVINDCSTDNTLEVLKSNNINYLNLPINLGIGGAVQTGYKYALENDYDYVVQFDGDGQHDAKSLKTMEKELENESADMVIGSRFINNQGFQSSRMRRIGIAFFTVLIKWLTRQKITDPTSGLRMINHKVLALFAADYPSDYPEPETAVSVLKKGYRVKEVPVIMRERQGGESSINFWKSGWYMIKVTLAILFVSIKDGQ